MQADLTITREIVPMPQRRDDVHKGDVGRLVIIGGCYTPEVAMVGAPALAANAAFRTGAGLVQLMTPDPIRTAVATLAPCATFRTLPCKGEELLAEIEAFRADVVALGPGLGTSLDTAEITEFILRVGKPMVIDADGLNRIAAGKPFEFPKPERVVLTPHPGELRRMLAARGGDREVGTTPAARRAAACALVEAYGCTVVLKGRGTIVTDGRRLYVNETGNAGMATAGAGDVLTGIITALIGQQVPPFEAAILGVYLHGLAGDFAAEELGRHSVTAMDLIDFLPEAICEHEAE